MTTRPVPGIPVRAVGRIDVGALALYLSRPSLALGVYPASPWLEPGDSQGTADDNVPGKTDPRELGERLAEAVRRAVGSHRTVAVLHDGSLGATALLAAADAAGRAVGAEVTVVVADHPDPQGASVGVRAQQVIALLGGRHRFLLAEADRLLDRRDHVPGEGGSRGRTPWEEGPGDRVGWNPVAPDLGRTPLVRAGEARAAQLGASMILTPDGGEELLQSGPLPVPSGLAELRAASRGLADGWQVEGVAAALADAAAMLGRGAAARRLRARLQVAQAPFAQVLGRAPRVLAPDLRAHVEAWTAGWVSRLAEDLADDPDPVRAYVRARMARFAGPHPASVAAAAPVPRAAPFLDPGFIAWALRLPPSARYDARRPTPHLRRNRLLISLIPQAAHSALPATPPPPPSGTIPAARLPQASGEYPLCRELGLLVPGEESAPTEVRARLTVLEEWLAGYEQVSPGRNGG
ncbi:hypothetical protein [Nonomuraea endophytica]|uniref:Asparagine synthase (Glutamine-hydrolyzing) n=1 Tax=Nonomuraea endophytica TaxID=714136 RepID=A0A7W8A075_9ACTN|nr:hypothetical protein [Nonomuraea endophytica]MBB5076446.1 asparagine synthase (glutamine-hydrolyzing) [Nonomuraea endophytica]